MAEQELPEIFIKRLKERYNINLAKDIKEYKIFNNRLSLVFHNGDMRVIPITKLM